MPEGGGRSWPQPRVANVPESVESLGDEAVDLSADAGLHLDEWQSWTLEQALGFRRDGRWSSFEVGLVVPRQDGKGSVLEARMLAGLFLLHEQLITYTAHEFKTAQEHFLRISSLIETTPQLMAKVAKVRTSHINMGVELKSGARLRFLARSGGSGRGFSGDVVIFDEAMILRQEAMGALLPTMSARTNVTAGGPQLWYAGTAGSSTSDEAEVLSSVRDRGIEGSDRLCYLEWSAGDPDDHDGKDVDLDDRDEWYRANPAMWGDRPRITEEFVENERAALSDAEFARERLCLWGTAHRQPVIDPDVWKQLADVDSNIDGDLAFAVDVPPEGGSASIAVAGFREDGLVHVEVAESQSGTKWTVDWLAERVAKWRPNAVVLDPSSRAGALIPALTKAGVELTTVSGREMAQACGAFYDEVSEGDLRHLGQPTLNLAVDGARKRTVGDAWAWHRRDTSVDISPLVAATLARHGLNVEPEETLTPGIAIVDF